MDVYLETHRGQQGTVRTNNRYRTTEPQSEQKDMRRSQYYRTNKKHTKVLQSKIGIQNLEMSTGLAEDTATQIFNQIQKIIKNIYRMDRGYSTSDKKRGPKQNPGASRSSSIIEVNR